MIKGVVPVNLDNRISAATSVQMPHEIITPNGCHIKLIFSNKRITGVREGIAQLLLAAFEHSSEVNTQHETCPVFIQSIDS